MTDNIIIRPATPEDLATLLKFEQGVIAAERPFDPTLKPEPTTYYNLVAMLANPGVALLVAEYENQIIGSGYGRIEAAKPYSQHERYVYLGFMYVLPAYRGKGVNQKIIASLKAWAASHNITEMRLEVYFENKAAIKAYQKTGFTKHMIEMRMGF